jgi:hypothetical protein
MNRGLVSLWYKTFATPADDADWNSVSGFTELGEIKPDSLGFELGEEFSPIEVESQLGKIRDDLVAQSLVVRGTLHEATFTDLMVALGLTSAAITDKSAATPKRYQAPFGGYRNLNYKNIILRQTIADAMTLYRGIHVIKAHIHVAGPTPYSRKTPQELPFVIDGVVLTSGTHSGKFAYLWKDYELTTPAITTIEDGGAAPVVGNLVTINGTGFGKAQGSSTVTFNSAKVGVVYPVWNDNAIVVQIPAAATTGNVKVTVGGVDSNNVSLTIA